MPGMFVYGQEKIRPDVYHRIENAPPYTEQITNGVGGAVIQGNWGPLNMPVPMRTTDDVYRTFGDGGTVDAITLMMDGGSQVVYAVRAGTGGTKAATTLKDTAAVDVVTMTAKYEGTRALSVTIRDNLLNTALKDAIVYDGTRSLEVLSFEKGATGNEVDKIVAAFEESNYVVATKVADGAKVLQDVSQQALTGGANPTVTTAEYSTALNALETYRINVTIVDTDDADVHAILAAYNERLFAAGMLPMSAVAESMAIDINTRMEHAKEFNSHMMHYVLNAQYDKEGNVHEGYKQAAYVGGMISSIPSSTSLTRKYTTKYKQAAEPLTNAQIERALMMGCIVITPDAMGSMRIESGINTLNQITDPATFDEGWKKIRRVKTRYELIERANGKVDALIGNVNNDDNGRETVIAAINGVINMMVSEGKLLGGRAIVDPTRAPVGDSCWYRIGVDDIDSQERIYLTYQFRFSAV